MSQLIPVAPREIVTMTSLEIVDFINDLRKEDALNAGAAFPSPGFAKLEHSDFMKKVPEVLDGGAGNFSDTYVHPQNGQTYPCYRFPKREASLMAMSYSYKIQARVWDHMTALEEKLKAKEAAALEQPTKPARVRGPLTRSQVAAGILLLRSAAQDLKLAPSAVLGGYQKLEAQIGITGLLPDYAVDSPSTAATGSSEVTKSADELLKLHGVGMSTIAFNKLLVKHGFLEEQERPSTKGSGIKKFKVCTNMAFGKNFSDPKNPRAIQPHWFVSKFAELLALVLPPKEPASQGALL